MSVVASYDGTALHYVVRGEGSPLLCLPGGPGRAAAYLEDLGGLDRTRSLVLLDSRGTGRSELPADPGTLRFDRLADDVEAVRQHLGLDRLDLLGHSAGALVAQVWAASHPDRVRSLVLVTPPGSLQGAERDDLEAIRATRSHEPWYADAAAALAALDDAGPSERPALERQLRPFWYGRWDEHCQEHAASADRQTSKRAELGFATGLEQRREDIVAGLAEVRAPVLVVAGGRDALTGVTSARAVAGSFNDSRLELLPSAGHFPWVDEPEGFRSAVSGFLATI